MKVMKTYFCRKISMQEVRKTNPPQYVLMKGELVCTYPIYHIPNIDKWVPMGISMDDMKSITHMNEKDIASTGRYSDGVIYCLVFDHIECLDEVFTIANGGKDREAKIRFSRSPRWWEYAGPDQQAILCSLTEKQLKDAKNKGKTAVLSRFMPKGEMLWNEKSRMA